MILDNAHRRSALLLLLPALIGQAFVSAQEPEASPAAQRPAPADEPDRAVSLWLGRAESDNVGRTDTASRGSYNSLGTLLDLGYQSTRIEGSLSTDLELREYSDDAIDDEPVGTLDGLLRVALLPERLNWQFQDSYGQGQTDPFDATGPNNRESINVFSTGPELDLPLGDRTRLSVSGTRSARRYDDSDSLDNDATIYELGLFRQTTPTVRYGLRLSANEVEYDLPLAPAYDIDRASLHYQRSFSTGGVSIDLGRNELDFLGVTTSEPLLNFEWRRELATRSTLQIAAAREFSDVGGNLRAELTQGVPSTDSQVLLSSSPFEQQRLFVSYSLAGTRTNIAVSVGSSEESYVGDTTLDNDNTTARVSLQRSVTPRLGIGADFYRIKREFDASTPGAPSDDTERTLSAWVNRSLGRVFNLALVLTRYERSGTPAINEDRYELRFSYSPSRSAGSALGAAGR